MRLLQVKDGKVTSKPEALEDGTDSSSQPQKEPALPTP